MIYLAWAKETPYLKVGYSTNPDKRASELQTGCPFDVQIIGRAEGTEADEGKIHHLLDRFRHKGEWFKYALCADWGRALVSFANQGDSEGFFEFLDWADLRMLPHPELRSLCNRMREKFAAHMVQMDHMQKQIDANKRAIALAESQIAIYKAQMRQSKKQLNEWQDAETPITLTRKELFQILSEAIRSEQKDHQELHHENR